VCAEEFLALVGGDCLICGEPTCPRCGYDHNLVYYGPPADNTPPIPPGSPPPTRPACKEFLQVGTLDDITPMYERGTDCTFCGLPARFESEGECGTLACKNCEKLGHLSAVPGEFGEVLYCQICAP